MAPSFIFTLNRMEKVAKISKLYGSDGEAVINLFSTFPEKFSTDDPIFIKVDALYVPLYFDRFERRGRTNAIIKFADIDTERRIMQFMGQDLLLAELDEEPNDEFFMEELVGFKVEIMETESLTGELTRYIDSEINPLFEISIDGHSSLIPAVEEFIHSIDFDAQIIRFVVPEGLLDL